ncbi:MAG: hypothetical protein AAGB04_15890 [Pseudomonadota bacterium]
MLAVDSPRWAELEHAYGDATQTPAHLYQLFEKQNYGYGEDPNDVLFGCLCHQGSIYTATYAAVPHVLNPLPTQSTLSRVYLYMFLGQVAISTDAEPIPDDLQTDYIAAMDRAKLLAIEAAQEPEIEAEWYEELLSSVPALHGLATVHRVVEWMLSSREVCGLCKLCGSEFEVDCEKLPFEAVRVRPHPTMAPIREAPLPHSVGIQGTPQGPKSPVRPTSVSPPS